VRASEGERQKRKFQISKGKRAEGKGQRAWSREIEDFKYQSAKCKYLN
jgi:hypothetical protein